MFENKICDHWTCKVCWWYTAHVKSNWYNAGIIRLRICKNVLSKKNLVDHIYGLFLYTEQFIFLWVRSERTLSVQHTRSEISWSPTSKWHFVKNSLKISIPVRLYNEFFSINFSRNIVRYIYYQLFCYHWLFKGTKRRNAFCSTYRRNRPSQKFRVVQKNKRLERTGCNERCHILVSKRLLGSFRTKYDI